MPPLPTTLQALHGVLREAEALRLRLAESGVEAMGAASSGGQKLVTGSASDFANVLVRSPSGGCAPRCSVLTGCAAGHI